MIQEIAIWRLVLAGFVLASFSFLLGFLIAALCQASGRAADVEEERVKRILKYMGRIDKALDEGGI